MPSPQKKKSKCSGGNKNQKEPNNLCFNAVLLPREIDGTNNRHIHTPRRRKKGSVCTEVKKTNRALLLSIKISKTDGAEWDITWR